MRRSFFALVWLAVGGCVWGYPEYREVRTSRAVAPPVTLDTVVRLEKAGVSDDVIIEKVRTEGIASPPTSDEIVALKKEGLSDRLIEAVAQARTPPPGEIAPAEWTLYAEPYALSPWWVCGPWCWWWWWGYPHGYTHGWHGGWRR